MYQFGIGFKNGNQEYPIHKSTNKYKTESFDDYFPTRKDNSYKIKHVMDWLGLFICTIENSQKTLLNQEFKVQ